MELFVALVPLVWWGSAPPQPLYEQMLLTCGHWSRIHAVDRDAVALAKLFGPNTSECLVRSLCGRVDGLSCDAEPCCRGGHEDHAATSREMRQSGLCEENGRLDVGVEVAGVKVLGNFIQVGVVSKRGTATEISIFLCQIGGWVLTCVLGSRSSLSS